MPHSSDPTDASSPSGESDRIPLDDIHHEDGLSYSELSPAAARKIDDICDEFESIWTKPGQETPQIENFWEKGLKIGLSKSDGQLLLKELLIIDLNYRKSDPTADTLNQDDYIVRFPGCGELVVEAFHLAGLAPSSGISAVASQDTSRVPAETASDFRLVALDAVKSENDPHLNSTINEIPQQLGGYEIQAELGHGGMGVVYRAFDKEMKRTVAIKVMKEDRIDSQEAVERFRREIRLLANLNHDNIVRAYHTHVDEATHTRYLVMEFVEGVELESLSQEVGRLSVADACELIRQAALGLQHAHENGLIHRDMKPANLMLTARGQVKVLDLGLARPKTPSETDANVLLTQEGQWLGTPYYMSPEQGVVQGDIDHRSDIYSLGCTLDKFLRGETAFGNYKDATVLSILMQHANDEFPRVNETRRDLPRGLQRILLRMVEKKPHNRPNSAAEVAKQLKPYCKGSNLAGLYQTYKTGPPIPFADDPPAKKPLSWWKIAAGGLVPLLILAAVYFSWPASPKDNPPIDVLATIDVNRDAIHGDWKMEEGQLKSPAEVSHAILRLPQEFPAEFQLEITAHRKGNPAVLFIHRSPTTPFALKFVPPSLAVPLENGSDSPAPSHRANPVIEKTYDVHHKDQTFVFDVKPSKLTIKRDGKILIERTSYPVLSEDINGVPNRPGFYLATDASAFEFSQIRLLIPEESKTPPD